MDKFQFSGFRIVGLAVSRCILTCVWILGLSVKNKGPEKDYDDFI